MSFVHLHTHSQYSLLEATCRFKKLCDKAVADGMPAVAITDYGNMFGAMEFYFIAKSKGLKPILGLEVYIAPEGRHHKAPPRDGIKKPNRRLVLLAKNLNGYRNLCKISSIGYKEGFYYKPRIDMDVLREHNEDLIALSGGVMGQVPWTFINKGAEAALECIDEFKEIYGKDFYLELNKTGVSAWDEINPFLIKASKEKDVPLVAANDVHYLEQEDQVAQEVLICIGSNRTLHDETRYRLGSDQFYFKTSKQMIDLFKDQPEAIANTLKVAEQCDVDVKIKDEDGNPIYHLPSFPTKEGRDVADDMKARSEEGLKEYFGVMKKRGEEIKDEKPYWDRLAYELKVINGMGFNGYFLIVQDFINWAKDHDIPVGPGRGSGAGSLVAYSLKITDLDPMPYNLIFERFLNPERVSMPDFDIDFCQENRGRVIQYVTEKYGEQSVSQIITYGKLQTRAAIRDVGRVLGMTYGEVDVVAKLIPDQLGITLQESIDQEERLRNLMEDDPRVKTLIDLALKVEGMVRNAGIHAAGVIIADGEIVSHAPLYKGNDGENVVQFDMKHSEKIGLIKFDFLGLKTLTHIDEALRLVKKNRGKSFAANEISLKDPGIYELMSEGDAAGIFQFESDGMMDLLRKAQPTCFEDIVALNALYRPGPMDMIPEYIKRKSGKTKVKYAFAELEEITKETFGIIIYQEQVQLIAAKIANYSLGEADLLRRAMGKKIESEMALQKTRFLSGAKDNDFDQKKSEDLFDSMAEFAKYGFNKSHAAAYCVIAAQTAYLKRYFPVEFFAALLSTEMSDTDKVVKYIKDAQRRDIEVCAPDINISEYKFTVDGDKIFFSLGAIKGVGKAAVEAILEARAAREDKRFNSLEEFFEAVDLRRVNKKTIECLIKAGAFDDFGAHRAQLINGYGKFIERADRVKKDREVGQTSLFGLSEEVREQEKVRLEKCESWKRSARLAYEKEVLGFFLSDHPLGGLENIYKNWVTSSIENLLNCESKEKHQVVGLMSAFREIITKKGTRMAFGQLEDLSGNVELVIFPNTYKETEMKLKSDEALVVGGAIEVDGGRSKILVDKVDRLSDLIGKTKKMMFTLKDDESEKMNRLKDVLAKYPGEVPMYLNIILPEMKKQVQMELTEPKGVTASYELFEKLHGEFGDTNFVQVRV